MIYMSSRRTIQSGEVVRFATGFDEQPGVFGPMRDATGPFDVSASRDAVMVHRAACRTAAESKLLIEAIAHAERARQRLTETWRGGAPSMFPSEPTACVPQEDQ